MSTEKRAFSVFEPRETNKSVLKFSKNLVLKFHFLLLGALLTYLELYAMQ